METKLATVVFCPWRKGRRGGAVAVELGSVAAGLRVVSVTPLLVKGDCTGGMECGGCATVLVALESSGF